MSPSVDRYRRHLDAAWRRPVGTAPEEVLGAPSFGILVLAHLGIAFILTSLGALLGPLGDRSEEAAVGVSLLLWAGTAVAGAWASAPRRRVLSRVAGTFVLALSTGYLAAACGAGAGLRGALGRTTLLAVTAPTAAFAVGLYVWRRGGWLLVAATGWSAALALALVAQQPGASREAYGAALLIVAVALGIATAVRAVEPRSLAGVLVAVTAAAGAVVLNAGDSGAVDQLVGLGFVVVLLGASYAARSAALVLLGAVVSPVLLASVLLASGVDLAIPVAAVVTGMATALIAADVERRSPQRHRFGGVYAWSGLLVLLAAPWLVGGDSLVVSVLAFVCLAGLLVAATSARRRPLVVMSAVELVGIVPARIVRELPGGEVGQAVVLLAVGAAVLAVALRARPAGRRAGSRPVAAALSAGHLPSGAQATDAYPVPYAQVFAACLAELEARGGIEYVDRAAGRRAGGDLALAVWQPGHAERTHVAAYGEAGAAAALLADVAVRVLPPAMADSPRTG